jgi:ribonuclease-3
MNLDSLEDKINVRFKNKDLLKNAFIHRSFLNENPNESLPHNERLEFLGDSVLGFIISKYLYKKYPDHPEGDLTNFRSSIVNARILSKVAKDLGLGDYLYLSRGEEATGGRERQYILANTYESLLGAIFLDNGLSSATNFVNKSLIPNLKEIIKNKLYKDFKSQLQEISQAKFNVTPSYKLISTKGPDHTKIFETGAYLDKKLLAKGAGKSKQTSEQEAARVALEKIVKTK